MLSSKSVSSLVSDDVKAAFQDNEEIAQNATLAIDKPHAATTYVMVAALKQFVSLKGRMPKLIHVPKMLQVALTVDLATRKDYHGKLNKLEKLYGIPVVWDAEEFRME